MTSPHDWNDREYWVFCDESIQEGPLFSNFFGGAIVPSTRHAELENRLRIEKAEIGFLKELKWQRVTEQWLEGYKRMISAFFSEVRGGNVRMRVMFRQTQPGSERRAEQRGESYFKLYYQFVKHSFGLAHIPRLETGTRLRLFFDQFPHTRERVTQFKGFIGALPEASLLREAKLKLNEDHITEVDSKEHVLLQCVDLVLGAMAFRLNDQHLQKAEGQTRRGKRTIAKDKLYRHILSEIRTVKPALNPKISTGCSPFPHGKWSMPYRHWCFVSRAT